MRCRFFLRHCRFSPARDGWLLDSLPFGVLANACCLLAVMCRMNCTRVDAPGTVWHDSRMQRRRVAWGVVLVVGLTGAASRPARACEPIAQRTLSFTTLPTDGAVDVPHNVTPFVVATDTRSSGIAVTEPSARLLLVHDRSCPDEAARPTATMTLASFSVSTTAP
jgi:hypothetical protein